MDIEEVYRKLKYYESNLRQLYRECPDKSIENFTMLYEEVTSTLIFAQQFLDDEELKSLAEKVSRQMQRLDATSIEELSK